MRSIEFLLSFKKKQDNIIKYKRFINIWTKYDPAKAKQFERSLKWQIDKHSLAKVDNQYQIYLHGINTLTLFCNDIYKSFVFYYLFIDFSI